MILITKSVKSVLYLLACFSYLTLTSCSTSIVDIQGNEIYITDPAYIMAEGKILISGTANELAVNPETRRIYLVQNFRLD
jgi:ABC-type lipopolysaccharide export system ATPase subunit